MEITDELSEKFAGLKKSANVEDLMKADVDAFKKESEAKDAILNQKSRHINAKQRELADEIFNFYVYGRVPDSKYEGMIPKFSLHGLNLFKRKNSFMHFYDNGMVVIDGFPNIDDPDSFATQRIYVFPITKIFDVLGCNEEKDVMRILKSDNSGGYCTHGNKATNWRSRLMSQLSRPVYIDPVKLNEISTALKEYVEVDINELNIYEQKINALKTEELLTPEQIERRRVAKSILNGSDMLVGNEMYDGIEDNKESGLIDAERELAEALGTSKESKTGEAKSGGKEKNNKVSTAKTPDKKHGMSFIDICRKFSRTNGETLKSWTSRYKRNPLVSFYTKERTRDIDGNYVCDICGDKYTTTDMLEAHHIIPLSRGGADNICNTICLCPGCHKYIHSPTCGLTDYQKSEILNKLYDYISERDPEFLDYLLSYFQYDDEVIDETMDKSIEAKKPYVDTYIYTMVNNPDMYQNSIKYYDDERRKKQQSKF